MDPSDSGASRSQLRQPFIDTANALAHFYKQASIAERDARNAASTAAYRRVMQWAAQKARKSEQLTPAQLIAFCTEQLASIVDHDDNRSHQSQQQQHQHQQQQQQSQSQSQEKNVEAPPVAYIATDDMLVRDINRLNVNPRKRQRVDISDSFLNACNHPFVFQEPYLSESPRRESRDRDNVQRRVKSKTALYEKLRKK